MSLKASRQEFIAGWTNELERDMVSLWQLIAAARIHVDVRDEEDFRELVREALLSIFERGARIADLTKMSEATVVPLSTSILQTELSAEQLTDWVLADWKAKGKDPDPFDSLWFALPPDLENSP